MSERILVCVAWPYANGPLHLGHVAGCYLPADIFARYHRLKGNDVLMVSGSDQHGTPITVRAEQEGRSPAEVAETYHQSFLQSWQQLGISFDLFTRTGTENHAAVVQDMFTVLLQKGHIYRDTMSVPYCPQCERFLPDRYVQGRCPYCGFEDARGDQCDVCGKPLNALELGEPRCRICGTSPRIVESEHFFLRLSAFEKPLHDWVERQSHWRPNVLNFTLRFLEDGLRDRAITRDIEWGVTVPVPGFERKRIYVWFEAVIGYLSASIEWAQRSGAPERWRDFWQEPCRIYHFIGKDNIPFHTIIWPAMLMGYGGLNLPYDVPANEFLNLEGRQLSTSRNWAIWVPDFLSRYEADPLRYALAASMPEFNDSDFSWREFVRRNNDELVATYGNLVHRVLTFVARHFEGRVPAAPADDALSRDLLSKAEAALVAADEQLGRCRFRDALRTIMALAQEANRYLEVTSPWSTVRTDRAGCAAALATVLAVIACLKTLLLPFLPFSSQQLHRLLGLPGAAEDAGWSFAPLPVGQLMPSPSPLFRKLDTAVVEAETERLVASRA